MYETLCSDPNSNNDVPMSSFSKCFKPGDGSVTVLLMFFND